VRLRSVTTLLVVSWFLAYVLDPVIDRLERRRIPRAAGVVLLLLVACALSAAAVLLVVPGLTDQVQTVARALPGYVRGVQTELLPRIEALLGRPLPLDASALIAQATTALQGSLPTIATGAAAVFGRLFANAWNLVQALLSALLVPVFTFYLLLDFNGLGERLAALLPRGAQPVGRRLLDRCDEVLGAFVRGQLIVCAALALVYSAGLTLTGIDMPWVVGILSGALFIVPYLGTAVGLVLGTLLALLKFHDLGHVLGVWAVFAVGQGLEGFVLTPRIVGNRVGLHPLVVLLAILAGGELFGFTGILLAVPTAAVLRVGLEEALQAYRRSAFYRGATP
jgi:predicted PurR-regulated permease PerM